MVPNGDGPTDHPLLAGLDLPPLGVAGRAAPLVTKTLLFVGEGSEVVSGITRQGMWGTKFRAYDKRTGEVLWETDLAAGVNWCTHDLYARGKAVCCSGNRQRRSCG